MGWLLRECNARVEQNCLRLDCERFQSNTPLPLTQQPDQVATVLEDGAECRHNGRREHRFHTLYHQECSGDGVGGIISPAPIGEQSMIVLLLELVYGAGASGEIHDVIADVSG